MPITEPSEFWDFSLEVYARSEVSKLCLELQDTYGLDINMLLFACWVGHTGRGKLSSRSWQAMILRLSKWREEVIRPLRKLRHTLKHEQLAPEGMKERVFSCELEAEHVEQLLLEREWGASRHPLASGSAQRATDVIENLVSYFRAEKLTLDNKLAYRCERLARLISGLLDDGLLHQACHQAMGLEQKPGRQDLTVS